MYYRIIRNDFLKSQLITLTTVLFVAAAAMLVSLAVVLGIHLSSAIDTLMTKAKTPHFMQMHSGTIDMARFKAFAQHDSRVDAFQVLEFLNIDGSKIMLGEKSLAGNVQDNGLCTQSKKFDYLLDLDGNVIKVHDGEIYVPICYMKEGIVKVGDKAVICGKELTIKGFLRDSQMNSMLSSSKRFLVSTNDYEEIKSYGSVEYLIEFRLKDLSALSTFEAAYTSSGLEANGPTITYPLFKTLNAISDGLMIAVILLVSMLVVTITFLCIRFTLLAKIEEDYHEIGVMKAIGLRVSDIKKIYLAKYVLIAGTGSIIGFALSFVFRGMLLENIRLYMGKSEKDSFALLFGIIGVLFVFFTIIIYVNAVLRRFKKISVVQAIRFGASEEKAAAVKYFCLSKNSVLDTNVFIGVKDVLVRKRLYTTMLAVLIIVTFIIIVPQNLYNTISSKDFSSYMGIGKCDLRIDIQQTDDILRKSSEIARLMKRDKSISKYVVLMTKSFQVKTGNDSRERMKIEIGNHSVFPVKYAKGRAPTFENEIALSAINASELGKGIGDIITIDLEGNAKDLTVCGIYSDITNGGKTAKAVFKSDLTDIMWCVISAELSDKSLVYNKVLEYGDRFNFAKVSGIDEYVLQTFGPTISAIKKASNAATAASLIITLLVTLLFMRMLVAKDRYAIAVMKAFGFTGLDITMQYIWRSVFVLMIGIVLGTLLANTLGEGLAGMFISSFGASSFKFIIKPLSAYLFCPVMVICTALIATIIGTSGIEKIKISENIKE